MAKIDGRQLAPSSAGLTVNELLDLYLDGMGGSKGAELALLAATASPHLFGPVAAIAPSCVAWFGVDLTGGVADASARSSWTLGGRPVPFVPPVPGIGFERTE